MALDPKLYQHKYSPKATRKGTFVVKTFDINAVAYDGTAVPKDPDSLPYKLLTATTTLDTWAFGILLCVF